MSSDKTAAPVTEAAKKQRGQGIPVPVITLRKAIELMTKIWDKEKRNAASVPAVMSHWNYASKSSGGFQAIASLKKYGLLEEQGSNEKRTLKLSTLALDILKNSTLDLKEHSRLIKKAALTPKANQELWEKYGSELPSDQTIETHLVFEKNFSEGAAKAFIIVYRDAIEFAKLQKEDKVEEAPDVPETPISGDDKPAAQTMIAAPQILTPKTIAPFSAVPKGPILPLDNPATKYFAIPTDVGDAMIPMGMSVEDFTLFKGALELFQSKIVKATRFPIGAIWRNKDTDKPVTIMAELGEKDGVKYYQSQDGTGIPENELTFA